MINKKSYSERDICTKFITPSIEKAGWDKVTQLLEEVSFTDGKIYVRAKLTARGKQKRADYILYYKPNIPVAIVEAKDNSYSAMATGTGKGSPVEIIKEFGSKEEYLRAVKELETELYKTA